MTEEQPMQSFFIFILMSTPLVFTSSWFYKYHF